MKATLGAQCWSDSIRFLATGSHLKELSFPFRISEATVGGGVEDECLATRECLQESLLSFPPS
jgi:hypothetical protein